MCASGIAIARTRSIRQIANIWRSYGMTRSPTVASSNSNFEFAEATASTDGIWDAASCNVTIPKRSPAGFSPPSDIAVENQALLQAEGANRIKDEFLATVSHELRNPLNAIVGWVNLLQSGSLDAAGSKCALETIERNVHLQVSLIDEILDLSRIAKGKVHLTLRQINLTPLIESALDVIRPRAEAKNLHGNATDRHFASMEIPNAYNK